MRYANFASHRLTNDAGAGRRREPINFNASRFFCDVSELDRPEFDRAAQHVDFHASRNREPGKASLCRDGFVRFLVFGRAVCHAIYQSDVVVARRGHWANDLGHRLLPASAALSAVCLPFVRDATLSQKGASRRAGDFLLPTLRYRLGYDVSRITSWKRFLKPFPRPAYLAVVSLADLLSVFGAAFSAAFAASARF